MHPLRSIGAEKVTYADFFEGSVNGSGYTIRHPIHMYAEAIFDRILNDFAAYLRFALQTNPYAASNSIHQFHKTPEGRLVLVLTTKSLARRAVFFAKRRASSAPLARFSPQRLA